MGPCTALTGRASAKAEAMAVPLRNCRRDAFERESKVGLAMSGKRFIWVQRSLSSHIELILPITRAKYELLAPQKKREALRERLPELST